MVNRLSTTSYYRMKRSVLLFSILLFTVIPITVKAQNDLAIGQWKAHLPYTTFINAAQNKESLFFSTEWSLLIIDKEENTTRFLSKVDGLSETGVRVIGTNKETGLLVVTYDNAVFDIITSDGIRSVIDISKDGNFNDRSINNLTFDGTRFLYFATGFGVTKYDLERNQFVYTVDTGIPVLDIAIFKNNIYVSTEDGIYTIDKGDNANQQAFGEWSLLGATQNFPPNYLNSFLEVKDDVLYLDVDEAFMKFDGEVVDMIRPAEENFTFKFLTADGVSVLAGYECGAEDGSGCRGKIISYSPSNDEFTELDNSCLDRPTFAIEDEDGTIWSTDLFRKIRKTNTSGGDCKKLEFNAPFSQFVSEIAVINKDVYVASGGLTVGGNSAERKDGVFVLDEQNNWSRISEEQVPRLLDSVAHVDLYRVIGHPSNGKVYIGTNYGGLIEMDGEEYTIYNDTNSSLQGAEGDERRERVVGMAFDENNNLWLTNNDAPLPISVLTDEGEWRSFSLGSVKNINQLAIDRLGYKWAIVRGTSQGLVVFDDNGTLDDISDDRTRVITAVNSNLPDNLVRCIETDKDGDIWVGTIDGVVVFECGSTAFEESCIGNKRIIEENEVDDETENLLKGEVINTIGIDGANRKWFGTSSGIFVQDANGTKNIAFYNEANSPLLDNNVIDIAFNDDTGDVYIGTAKGIISLRGEAIVGNPVNDANIFAYPNPVRPDYDGPIAIRGLAENANVKITDINGQLIFETTALGGQAIWNGKDYNGRKASTGVYLVFSTADNITNLDAVATKILFIK